MTAIFNDTFTGVAGALSAHAADTGQSWAGSGSQAQLDGAGRLINNVMGSSPNLVSNAVIPQADMSMELQISIGTIPSDPTYNHVEKIVLMLWDRYNYNVEMDTQMGDPRVYIATYATGSSSIQDFAVESNTVHTIRWDLTIGSSIKTYYDGVLISTVGAPQKSGASTALGGYLERYHDSGATDRPVFLSYERLTLDPIAPPVTQPFWTAFRASHEVP